MNTKRNLFVIATTIIVLTFGIGVSVFAEKDSKSGGKDTEILMSLVKKARTDLNKLRAEQGLGKFRVSLSERGEARSEHREGRESRGEHGSRGEGREGTSGHNEEGERGELDEAGEGEESAKRVGRYQKWDNVRKGAHLVIAYDPTTQSFKGVVSNVSKKTLKDVRVEVHLSNGVELGPTKRQDLLPGKKMSVELAANDQKFNWWTTHPEHGEEEGHGPDSGGEGHEGSAKRSDKRPTEASLRPLYNQLQLLCKEIDKTKQDLSKKK